MTTKKTITCLLVAAIGVGMLAMAGLSEKPEELSAYQGPEDAIGKRVRLYIKPTSFGGANEEGALLTDNINGANRSVYGTLIALNDEWITVSVPSGIRDPRPGSRPEGEPDYISFERDAVYAIRVGSAQFDP